MGWEPLRRLFGGHIWGEGGYERISCSLAYCKRCRTYFRIGEREKEKNEQDKEEVSKEEIQIIVMKGNHYGMFATFHDPLGRKRKERWPHSLIS